MSAHSRFPWSPADPVTDELVNEVARCVNFNRHGYRFTPPAYGTFSTVDRLIYTLCRALDAWDYEQDFREYVGGLKDVPYYFIDLAVRALPLLKLPPPPKGRTKPPPVAKSAVPKVN
jgi:hypothetical protein